MDSENGRTSSGTIMFSFLLGGIVGAGLALLLAPQSGADTRRKISETAEDLRRRADDVVKQARGSVAEAIETGKEVIAAGKEAYHREKEKGVAQG